MKRSIEQSYNKVPEIKISAKTFKFEAPIDSRSIIMCLRMMLFPLATYVRPWTP